MKQYKIQNNYEDARENYPGVSSYLTWKKRKEGTILRKNIGLSFSVYCVDKYCDFVHLLSFLFLLLSLTFRFFFSTFFITSTNITIEDIFVENTSMSKSIFESYSN